MTRSPSSRTPHRPIRSRPNAAGLISAALLVATTGIAIPGCQIIGVAAENYKRTSTRTVEPEYEGLVGKSFAVVVTSDRGIESMNPGVVDTLIDRITARIRDESGASGFVPAVQVLKYTYDNPAWISRPLSELAKSLGGVDRLVFVDLYEFRLHDPGNAYEWGGVAAGTVAVLEMDSPLPDSHAFERKIQVKFPDKPGMGPAEFNANVISSTLVKRFVDRSTWLFYKHEEPYYPDY